MVGGCAERKSRPLRDRGDGGLARLMLAEYELLLGEKSPLRHRVSGRSQSVVVQKGDDLPGFDRNANAELDRSSMPPNIAALQTAVVVPVNGHPGQPDAPILGDCPAHPLLVTLRHLAGEIGAVIDEQDSCWRPQRRTSYIETLSSSNRGITRSGLG